MIKKIQILHGLLIVALVSGSGCSSVSALSNRTPSTQTPEAVGKGYRLQPGDQVNIQIYREPQLSGTFQLDPAGLIRHPLCGPFKASGLTIEQAEAGLTELLGKKYLVDPKVTISIVAAQSSQVVLLGEVVNPGVHPVPFGQKITLLQAVAEAGGFTDLASVNRVTVVRRVDGKERSIRVKVSKMISGEEPDMLLQPDDVVMVPQVVF